MSARRVVFLVLLAWLVPAIASACAVCTGAGEESRGAFIATTVMMSVLPVAMVGGVVWWIWRRTKASEDASTAASRDLAASSRTGLRG